MNHKLPSNPVSDLPSHPWEEPSVFTPEALIEAVRAERQLPKISVPEVCLLDFDGDLTDWLVQSGQVRRWESWACFHTHMEAFDVEGVPIGLIARTIGGPYAVLIAEQLAASGAKVIIGITSAGRVSATVPVPALVVATSAIRDEGTSVHYLPPNRMVAGDAELASALSRSLGNLGLPLLDGAVWTTDAPYRETASQLSRYANDGVLAVEMPGSRTLCLRGGAAWPLRCGRSHHQQPGQCGSPRPVRQRPPGMELRIVSGCGARRVRASSQGASPRHPA